LIQKTAAIVLAAGKGKRMKSDLPKVLHEIHGRPMIKILLDTLATLKLEHTVVVIGHKGEQVQRALYDYPVSFAWQREQLGTGHAVMMTRELMADFDGLTLVIVGDAPFLSVSSVNKLIEVHCATQAVATCLSMVLPDPAQYGRIIRDGKSNRLLDIIEFKDADEKVRQISEVNSGIFCFDNRSLFSVIDRLDRGNAQREYYLTDIVKIFNSNGLRVSVVPAERPEEVLGVNSEEDLEDLARQFPL
jgi:UDP-N-acetylglucosamine diphosphorylase/glucosamine-1-phosphate N-acetyltransferase